MKDSLDRLRSAIGDAYVIEGELGTGAMGTVYRVHDRKRGETIALKTLHRIDPSTIFRFKQEFRALADVAHENLVQLYELVAHENVWFFTMEFVDGVSFIEHVRPSSSATTETDITEIDPVDSSAQHLSQMTVAAGSGSGVLDAMRLRQTMHQLLQGVTALHRAGKIHRDLKPSNVLVTSDGHVKILDFGITADIARSQQIETAEHAISGTVGYMAPEQCAGEACGPESDVYALGVLLFEALTGRLPFSGPLTEVFKQKREVDAPRPDEFATGLPNDLVELCVSLLARDPPDRPSDHELLNDLRISEPAVLIDRQSHSSKPGSLVGRSTHLEALEAAFADVTRGNTVSMCVLGPSGIGKTTLVRHFTDSLVRDERAVVLAGRCYASESVPFKAFDGVVDMLSRLLRGLEERFLEPRLPKDTAALAHVFPVLRRVPAVERKAAGALGITDQWELRRRAFTAFRETLADISRERPLVLHIDDLQWVDRDSTDVLDDVLRSMENLRVFFILSFRSEEVASVPLLTRLLDTAPEMDRMVLEVGPLSHTDAANYAQEMLSDWRSDSFGYARSIAQESDGNPFLLDQMVRVALEAGSEGRGKSLKLEDMLNARFEQLPEGARALSEALAVAGLPIDADVAFQAAGLTEGERPLITSLRLARLLRVAATTNRINLYHDRIRENLARGLSEEEKRDIHLRLAEGIEAKGVDDPEALYEHYLGAGDKQKASVYAAKAGAGAQKALAFERAALFYERAIELSADSNTEIGSWYIGLGDALASAGRGGEAVREYLEAIAHVDEHTAIEVQRRAGQAYLVSGRIAEGLAVIATVLRKVGLPQLPPTPKRALFALVRRRIRVAIRGLKYDERAEVDISSDQLTRIDTCWAVAEGMALVDNIQGAAYQTLHLLLALDAGEPNRVGRALAMEAGFSASSGATAKAASLLEQAEQLAERIGSRTIFGLCRMIGAVSAVHGGRSAEAERFAVEAEEILSKERGLSAWPLYIARVYHISALIDEGKIVDLCRVSREYLDDALDRGNLFAATMFRSGWSTLLWLSPDDLPGARDALDKALAQCPSGVFYIPHYNCLLSRGMIDLYACENEAAYEHIAAVWPTLERSLVLRIRSVRVRCLRMYAACAIAAASEGRDRKRLLALAEKLAKALERERHYSVISNNAKAKLLRAGIASTRGDLPAALEHLSFAIDRFKECGSAFWHALSLRRKGQMLEGDEGRALMREADDWMACEGIKNPARMTAAFIPGFPLGKEGAQTLRIRTPLGLREPAPRSDYR
jgi:serine/threonine protein kinase/tetratricopeptide (TPR) repeat protein